MTIVSEVIFRGLELMFGTFRINLAPRSLELGPAHFFVGPRRTPKGVKMGQNDSNKEKNVNFAQKNQISV